LNKFDSEFATLILEWPVFTSHLHCMCDSAEQYAGEYQFEMRFESQKKVAKSSPWTVSMCYVFRSTPPIWPNTLGLGCLRF